MRTKHLHLDESGLAGASNHGVSDGARISGIPVPYFPEPPPCGKMCRETIPRPNPLSSRRAGWGPVLNLLA
jgi:hypothetical protein